MGKSGGNTSGRLPASPEVKTKKVKELTGDERLRAELVWTQSQLFQAQKEKLALQQKIMEMQGIITGMQQRQLMSQVGIDVTKIQRNEDGSFTIEE